MTNLSLRRKELIDLHCKSMKWSLYDGNNDINSFHATGLFLYTLKTSENQIFCFQGVEKETVDIKWVKAVKNQFNFDQRFKHQFSVCLFVKVSICYKTYLSITNISMNQK